MAPTLPWTPDLVLIAGTTALFPYIVEPVINARTRGSLTVEVNPEATVLSSTVDFSLRGPAGTWLPLLAEALAARDPETSREPRPLPR